MPVRDSTSVGRGTEGYQVGMPLAHVRAPVAEFSDSALQFRLDEADIAAEPRRSALCVRFPRVMWGSDSICRREMYGERIDTAAW